MFYNHSTLQIYLNRQNRGFYAAYFGTSFIPAYSSGDQSSSDFSTHQRIGDPGKLLLR